MSSVAVTDIKIPTGYIFVVFIYPVKFFSCSDVI